MRTEPLDLDAACDVLYARAHIGGEAGRETCEMILFAAGVPALVAEVERLRAVETAVKQACTHDAHCEEEGEGECCFRAWRAVVLAAGCARPVTHEDVELLAALHPQEQSDA